MYVSPQSAPYETSVLRIATISYGVVRCGAFLFFDNTMVRCGASIYLTACCGLDSFFLKSNGAARWGSVRVRLVRCGVVRCGAVRYGAVRCGAVRCGAMRCFAVLSLSYIPGINPVYVRTYTESRKKHIQLSSAQLSAAVQRSAVQRRAVLRRAVPCRAVLSLSYMPK